MIPKDVRDAREWSGGGWIGSGNATYTRIVEARSWVCQDVPGLEKWQQRRA